MPCCIGEICLLSPRMCWSKGLHHRSLSTAVIYILWAASSRHLRAGREQPTWPSTVVLRASSTTRCDPHGPLTGPLLYSMLEADAKVLMDSYRKAEAQRSTLQTEIVALRATLRK